MTNLKPNKMLHAWSRQSALDRVANCLAMLSIHGFVTDKERERIHKRMVKWVEREKAKE